MAAIAVAAFDVAVITVVAIAVGTMLAVAVVALEVEVIVVVAIAVTAMVAVGGAAIAVVGTMQWKLHSDSNSSGSNGGS